MEKTNVMRLLDLAHISYVPHDYDASIVDGVTVARTLNQDEERVFKTLICVSDRKDYFVFDVPVAQELDLKKAAKVSQRKSIEMIPLKELLPLTGYWHGGCSPIGLKKPFPVFVDETAQLFDTVFVSAGKRGCQIEISPLDLQRYTQAVFADLLR